MKVPGTSDNAAIDEKPPWLGEDQENSSTSLKADIVDRYRILLSIVAKLKQELSIKDQMIWLLKADQTEAQKACHAATKELSKIKRKVKNAAREQQLNRREQTRKIASIVSKLVAEFEALTKNDGLSTVAMQNLQPLLESCRTSTAGLEVFDSEQAKTLENLEKGPDLLRQRLVQDQTSTATTSPLPTLTEVGDIRSADHENVLFASSLQFVPSSPKLPDPSAKHLPPDNGRIRQLMQALEVRSLEAQQWQRRAMELQTALHESKAVHQEVTGKLRTEIQAVFRKLTTSSAQHREDVNRLKDENRVLEVEGRERMKALSRVQPQKCALQEELGAMKRTLEVSERDRTQALYELGQSRNELRSINQKYLHECQKHVAKLAENLDSFNADRSKMMSKLKAKDERIEELKVQLGKRTADQSKGTEVRLLQDETDSLQYQLAELRAQSATREAEMLGLRNFCIELQEDIAGLNVALQAKQQENALLKRHRAVRQVAIDTPNSRASMKSSTTRSTARMHRQFPEEPLTRPPKPYPDIVDAVKRPAGHRQVLSTITNHTRTYPNVSSMEDSLLTKSAAHEEGWPLLSQRHMEIPASNVKV